MRITAYFAASLPRNQKYFLNFVFSFFSFNFIHCFESLNNFNSNLLTNYYLFSSCFNIFSGSHLLPNPSTMATTTRTRTQTRTAAGTPRGVGRPRRGTGNSVGRPRTSPRMSPATRRATGKRVGRPKRDEDYDYGTTKPRTNASRKQPPPDPADDDANPAGGLARAGGKDPVLARLDKEPGSGGGSGDGGSDGSQDSSQTGSGNDESHHSDANSIADEDDGNPAVIPFEVPGAPPVIIGRTPAEQRFSQYLAGPPFDCTDKARRVLYFQQFKSWDAVRDMSRLSMLPRMDARPTAHCTPSCMVLLPSV